jgi:hypothetical protein
MSESDPGMPSFVAEYLPPGRILSVHELSKHWNNHLMTHFSDVALTQKHLQFKSKQTSQDSSDEAVLTQNCIIITILHRNLQALMEPKF